MSEFILNCIEVGTQFLTAVATVFTVCFAYKQIEEAKREADEARNYDREQRAKAHQEAILENAYRVEAWIARDSNAKEPSAVKDETHERVLIVRNDSSGPIRNVQIEIEWPTEWTHDNALLHSGDAAALAAPGAYNPMLT